MTITALGALHLNFHGIHQDTNNDKKLAALVAVEQFQNRLSRQIRRNIDLGIHYAGRLTEVHSKKT